jgi:dihydroorotate dehydrogenase (NAD+) catalytic subunit
VLVNTVLGLAIDIETRRPRWATVRRRSERPGILPVALRSVYDCRAAFPSVADRGRGRHQLGRGRVAMLMAGANAVEVGTATFANPRAPWRYSK